MRLLLDTHALLWWLSNQRLGPRARALITDPGNDVLASVVSLWEIVIKVHVGKLAADVNAVERALGASGFERLPITAAHLPPWQSWPHITATRSTTCSSSRPSPRMPCSSHKTAALPSIPSSPTPASIPDAPVPPSAPMC